MPKIYLYEIDGFVTYNGPQSLSEIPPVYPGYGEDLSALSNDRWPIRRSLPARFNRTDPGIGDAALSIKDSKAWTWPTQELEIWIAVEPFMDLPTGQTLGYLITNSIGGSTEVGFLLKYQPDGSIWFDFFNGEGPEATTQVLTQPGVIETGKKTLIRASFRHGSHQQVFFGTDQSALCEAGYQVQQTGLAPVVAPAWGDITIACRPDGDPSNKAPIDLWAVALFKHTLSPEDAVLAEKVIRRDIGWNQNGQ